ncbi:MAG: helix-turn-helix transcriptional regulator [Nocardioidaceae bacterium]
MASSDRNGLGPSLKSVRDMLGKSLKAVAEPAGISPAYLVKLEKGEVTTPSPHVLHRLAGVLGVEYLELMRLAGYVVPEQTGPRMNALSQALSSNDLTDDEAKALTAFLEMYRRGKLD